MATQFACRLAFISFATATLRGCLCGADFFGTIQNALISLGMFFLLGLIVGDVARRLVEESVRAELMRLASASGAKTPAQPG